jgi:hypothetical protein
MIRPNMFESIWYPRPSSQLTAICTGIDEAVSKPSLAVALVEQQVLHQETGVVIIRTRLCIHPVAQSCCMPAFPIG